MPARRFRRCIPGFLPVLLLLGCADGGEGPTTPSLRPPPPGTAAGGYIWGHVVDDSGICLRGAVVEIIAGPGTGRKATQEIECTAWDYAAGYEFRDLPMGVVLTLRATRNGYRPQERDLVTGNGGPPFQFSLERD